MKAAPLRLAAIAALVLPVLAQAHPGHTADASFVQGALHPLLGLDHLLLLAAGGVLAARLGGRALGLLGALFLGLIGAGAMGPHAAVSYAAGLLLTSASLMTMVATALKLAPRMRTAASPR